MSGLHPTYEPTAENVDQWVAEYQANVESVRYELDDIVREGAANLVDEVLAMDVTTIAKAVIELRAKVATQDTALGVLAELVDMLARDLYPVGGDDARP